MQTTITTNSSYLDTVPLEEAKAQLRISLQDTDLEIERVIESAVDWCESQCDRTLRTAVSRLTVSRDWCGLGGSLPSQPVLAITSLKYLDADEAEQTVAVANYRLHKSADTAARLELDGDYSLPTLAARDDAVQLAYTTGYTTVADIPPRAKQAIRMMLTVFWGDLMPREIDSWEARARDLLGSLQWGAYR